MNSLEQLILLLSKFPGIGKKSAARMALYLLQTDRSYNDKLGQAIRELQNRIFKCSRCGSYTEEDPCSICTDMSRRKDVICVVEQSRDVMLIDSTGEFNGLFFVLNGVMSPLDGIGPDNLGLPFLKKRVEQEGIKELIIATNPTVEGDTTALYIRKMLQDIPVSITRIASGLPVGSDMEYADRLSIARSFRARQTLS